ncbi:MULTISPECIES: hypothetical protein [unclassified Ruegeria]|uniref:hypothetical protein n=1 Tax=unclassified Ruegeria TaxID=2625375 RepID=UPI0014910A7F|nr:MULTISPECIES: hypothetical protein [unclassified Ruegeria]NOD49762.1 hypothetical protein [Ruegeria sp. HKCCD5849]NOD54136.1 hypothetical protein [Ruegeria sp. HKCCD5851]NOD70093.1 hypothetical protein [Ruegeria sp. HKCCD7303]
MRPVQEWRIHLGAHKTATTHLQDTLLAHRDQLAQKGIDYIPREVFGPLQRRYSNPNHWRRRFWSAPLAYQFRRHVNALRNGAETVLLSDEDLLGYSDDLLARDLYPSFRGEHLVNALSRGGTVKLFLGIRAYDKLLPSAYAQMLKTFVPRPEWALRIGDAVLDAPPSWPDLIERLLSAFPNASLQVWKHEDYRVCWQEILTEFAGRDVGVFPDLPPPERTTSPSHEAIRKAEALDRSLSVQERRACVKRIYYEELPAGPDRSRFHPYRPETVAALQQKYAQDLQRIEREYPGMLFQVS